MLALLKQWYERHFTNPEAVILFFLIILGTTVLLTMGTLLAPVIAAVIMAFVLDWLINGLTRLRIPRVASVYFVFAAFIGVLASIVLLLIPMLWQQTASLLHEAPSMISAGQDALLQLPERYPEFFAVDQMNDIIKTIKSHTTQFGQTLVTISLSSIPALITLVVYLIIVPLMIFFFLKDKESMMSWFARLMPNERGLSLRVWDEVHDQLGNYILGKLAEVFITGIFSIIIFWFLSLKYYVLLGALVGLSVLVPYVGATVIAIPVIAMGLFQFGLSPEFWYVAIAYGVIQAIDGNILAPLLFSEAINMHPVAIIVAIVFFGGLWGFWGVFFAIPLAILIKAVINAWP